MEFLIPIYAYPFVEVSLNGMEAVYEMEDKSKEDVERVGEEADADDH